jgi:hypothetical protein
MMQTVRHLSHIVRWNLRGKPVPPPHVVKQRVIKAYARRFGLSLFVETGTYLGEMVEAVRAQFREVYSIELSPELTQNARRKFAIDPRVHIIEGDSGEVLPSILEKISEPCLFWLDGHFSGGITAQGSEDYPVLRELAHISRHHVKNHVILIDDARLFVGDGSAPAKPRLVEALRQINPRYRVEERDDIIRAFVV